MSSLKLMLFLPLAALCAPAGAAQDTSPAKAQGMVVVRDAQSGQFRTPSAAEFRALQQQQQQLQQQQQQQQRQHKSSARAASAAPAVVTGPHGSRSVRLGERHMVYSVVTRDSEGKLVEQCLKGEHAAEHAASQPVPATKHEEHAHESH